MTSAQAQRIVDNIVEDISDRSGIGDEWYGIDEDIQEEIKATWLNIILSS